MELNTCARRETDCDTWSFNRVPATICFSCGIGKRLDNVERSNPSSLDPSPCLFCVNHQEVSTTGSNTNWLHSSTCNAHLTYPLHFSMSASSNGAMIHWLVLTLPFIVADQVSSTKCLTASQKCVIPSHPSAFDPMSATFLQSEFRFALSQPMPQNVQAYYKVDAMDPNRERKPKQQPPCMLFRCLASG